MKKIISLFLILSMMIFGAAIFADEIILPSNEGVFQGHTYKLFDEKFLWQDAKEYCEKMGGHLATVTSAEENDYIAGLIPENSGYIIGMHRDFTGYERWVTGEAVSYLNWAEDQPDDRNGTQPNLILGNKMSWYTKSENCWDDSDDYVHGFICEWDSIVDCKNYDGHTYRVFDSSMSWEEAKEKCESLGGHLVTISSETENTFVTELISQCGKNLYWIGCSANEDNIWKWVDGSVLTYDNWAYREPNDTNGKEMYGHMFRFDYEMYDAGGDDHNAGEWNDIENYGEAGTTGGYTLGKIGYVCEWDYVFSSFGSEISQWATEEIEKAYSEELIPESLVGEDLTKPITRAEFAAVSVKAYEHLANTKALPAVNNPFNDTSDVEVLKALNAGITAGISKTQFSPDTLLNREQAATMLTRVFKRATMLGWTLEKDSEFKLSYKKPASFADDSRISAWAKDSVYFMVANEIINGMGDNKFAPQNITSEEEATAYANATREQALIIATRMVEKLK